MRSMAQYGHCRPIFLHERDVNIEFVLMFAKSYDFLPGCIDASTVVGPCVAEGAGSICYTAGLARARGDDVSMSGMKTKGDIPTRETNRSFLEITVDKLEGLTPRPAQDRVANEEPL